MADMSIAVALLAAQILGRLALDVKRTCVLAMII